MFGRPKAFEPVLLIIAGGTIVSDSYNDPRQPPENVTPLKPEDSAMRILSMLAHSKLHDKVVACNLLPHDYQPCRLGPFQKDSKQFTKEDIERLADIIAASDSRQILITHGTDRMAENAEALKHILAKHNISNKVVVFAGSMVPLSMETKDYKRGDALDNLQYALEHMPEKHGVYLVGRSAKSGRLQMWDPERVTKDRDSSRENLQFTVRDR